MAVLLCFLLLVLPVLLLMTATEGLLGERAYRYVTELTDEGKRQQLHRRLHEADRANEADYVKARSAMNVAADQGWRDLSEWRDG